MERNKSETVVSFAPSTVPTLSSSQTTTPTGSYQDLTNVSSLSRGERLGRKRSKSRSTQGDFRIHLTLEQKLGIVISEYELAKTEKYRRQNMNEKKIDQLEV